MSLINKPKISICFFGITRSLMHTIESINDNIIEQAQSIGDTKVFCHFFEQDKIYNPRTGENGQANKYEIGLLPCDELIIEKPYNCIDFQWSNEIKKYGDYWNNEFNSLNNLFHQLHSLKCVTEMSEKHGADITIYCRPDLYYHDSLRKEILKALKYKNTIQMPYWQSWDGLNDRFAICSGPIAATTYGCRIKKALIYCQNFNKPLHSESLLHFCCNSSVVDIRLISARATRIRLNGVPSYEDFRHPISIQINNIITNFNPRFNRIGRVISGISDRVIRFIYHECK